MLRRNFLKISSMFGVAGVVSTVAPDVAASPSPDKIQSVIDDRKYWVGLLDKIATPVLSNMSKGLLVKNMRVQNSPTYDKRDRRVAYMEAFGRLIAGIAPFLAAPDDDTAEGKVRKRLREQTLLSLKNAVDPQSPDYLFWGTVTERQPLVDAAYIAQALLVAPRALWDPLDATTKGRIIHEFTTIRQIKPFNNNWVLFAAMIESFLLSINIDTDSERIDSAINTIQGWYAGDGWYKDGDLFHFDHYNGYVIHAMLIEVLKANIAKGRRKQEEYDVAYKRMQRYSTFQERYISPEGTFPVFGRSSTYRVGAFWPLCKLALENKLPEEIIPAQVRCALTAVMKNIFVPSTFDKDGWLQLGFVGDKQANLADSYSNTGSLYITSLVFWPLGLPATHEFWSTPFTEWTQRKAWSGKPFKKDYAVNY